MMPSHGLDKNGMPVVLDIALGDVRAQRVRPNFWVFPPKAAVHKPFVHANIDQLRKQMDGFSPESMAAFFGGISVQAVYDNFYRTSPFHNGGWELFSDLPAGASILVIEAGLGSASLAISRLASEVWTVFEDADLAKSACSRAEHERISNLTVVCTSLSKRLPFHDASFDAVAVRGWGDELRPQASFAALLSELRRVLKSTGSLYVDGRGFFPLFLGLRMRLAGFTFPNILIHLVDKEKLPYEIRCGLKHSRLRSMIKNFLYLLQPSRLCGLLSKRSSATHQTTMLDHILSEIPNETTVVKRDALPLHFGSFDIYGLRTDRHVIRMPTTNVGERRCETSMQAMRALEKHSFSFEMPKFTKFGKFRGQSFYAESRIPGRPAPYLSFSKSEMQRLRKGAQTHLAELYQHTRHSIVMGTDELNRFFFDPLSAMSVQVFPSARQPLTDVKKLIEARLKGKTVDLVHTHGDFKASNFLLDDDGNISGLIDWDMAKPDGLPLTDVIACEGFHLSVSEKMVLPLALFEAAFRRRDEIIRSLHADLAVYANSGVGYDLAALMMLVDYYLKHPAPELRINKIWNGWASDSLSQACQMILSDTQRIPA